MFYESGLSINVLYTLVGSSGGRDQAIRRDEDPRRAWLVQVRATESKVAGTIHGSYFVIKVSTETAIVSVRSQEVGVAARTSTDL